MFTIWNWIIVIAIMAICFGFGASAYDKKKGIF